MFPFLNQHIVYFHKTTLRQRGNLAHLSTSMNLMLHWNELLIVLHIFLIVGDPVKRLFKFLCAIFHMAFGALFWFFRRIAFEWAQNSIDNHSKFQPKHLGFNERKAFDTMKAISLCDSSQNGCTTPAKQRINALNSLSACH